MEITTHVLTSPQHLDDTRRKNVRGNIGLDKVDNTADLDKPISNATQDALDNLRSDLEQEIDEKGSVNSISINGSTPVSPDENQNIDLTISEVPTSEESPVGSVLTVTENGVEWAEPGHVDVHSKADKVVGAVAGHVAGLDETGNLTDTGYTPEQLDNKIEVIKVNNVTMPPDARKTVYITIPTSTFIANTVEPDTQMATPFSRIVEAFESGAPMILHDNAAWITPQQVSYGGTGMYLTLYKIELDVVKPYVIFTCNEAFTDASSMTWARDVFYKLCDGDEFFTVSIGVWSHKHENKAILDATTASYTAEEKSKLAGIEPGSQANRIEIVKVGGVPLVIDLNDKSVDVPAYIAGQGIAIAQQNHEISISPEFITKIETKTDWNEVDSTSLAYLDNHPVAISDSVINDMFEN